MFYQKYARGTKHNNVSEHTKRHFKLRERYTRTGVHYKFYKDEGLGEWYNPNTVIGEDGRGVSIAAGGNYRWVEFKDTDGEI